MPKTWKGATTPQPTRTSTEIEILDDPFENRRYWFARHCHKHRGEMTPLGRLWEDAFEKLEGVSLKDYIAFAKKNKLGEKYAIPNRTR